MLGRAIPGVRFHRNSLIPQLASLARETDTGARPWGGATKNTSIYIICKLALNSCYGDSSAQWADGSWRPIIALLELLKWLKSDEF